MQSIPFRVLKDHGMKIIAYDPLLKKEDVENFYRKFCTSANMAISIVGDFDAQRMRDRIGDRFQDMRSEPPDIQAPKTEPLTGIKKVDRIMQRRQSLILESIG